MESTGINALLAFLIPLIVFILALAGLGGIDFGPFSQADSLF